MTTLDSIALVLAIAAMAISVGGLLLFVIVEGLHAGRWPWLLDWLEGRRWK